ncbi:MAG: carboxypeptidase regulatory-like domain-containing protein [Planctomycetes bacterium]|nr:carboxypeptidase regulatory-like domain-containing protein [Planctomycetota bacterium]
MRPLPVLILVLVAIAATITVILLNRGPQTPGDNVAVAPVEPGGAAVAPEEPTTLTPTKVEPDRTEAVEPSVALEGDDVEDAGPATNRITGRVINAQEQPVEGATVKISTDAMMGESLAIDWFSNRETTGKFLSTTTDAKGGYVFRGVEPARSYYLMAVHPDFAAVQEEGLRVPKAGEVRAPDLVLRNGSVLKGYVTDVQGQPIPDAVLDLDSAYMMSFEMQSPDRLTVKTDGQGYFEFKNVSPGPRICSVWAEGFERQIHHDKNFTGQPGEVQESNFKLGIGHPIAGRAFGPDNEGVKGAKVIALNYGSNVSSRGEVLTDDDGNFQIDGLAQGSYLLTVQAKGYRQAKQNRVQIGDLTLQIEMIRQATLNGRVVDAATGKPIENFQVQLLHVNTAVPIQGSATVSYEPTTVKETVKGATNGDFSLVGVDAGLFAIKVSAKGYASRVTDNFSVADGVQSPLVAVALSKGGTIKGRVVDGTTGQPISGVQVTSRDGDLPEPMAIDPFVEDMVASRTTERKVRTGSDGFFELKLLNPGRYRLQFEHMNFTTTWVADKVVLENQVTDAGSIQLMSGGGVKGKVVDASGKPCSRCVVRMFSDMEQFQARTSADGEYSIEHVKPGLYRLTASRAPGAGSGDVFDDVIASVNSEVQVQIGEGQMTTRDLVIGN